MRLHGVFEELENSQNNKLRDKKKKKISLSNNTLTIFLMELSEKRVSIILFHGMYSIP